MEQILEILKGVIHPETGRDIVTMGMVEKVTNESGKISFTIRLTKPHDPLSSSIRRAAEATVHQATGIMPTIFMAEGEAKSKKEPLKATTKTTEIGRVLAIASGKGGVGKSTVTANLAVALERLGYRVGILDVDIYGPSMPKMFGLEDHTPLATEENAQDIMPAQSHGIKVQSIGFFVSPSDALIWRGPMATNALKQLIHQTAWGKLDFLLLDLPPGTGDLHLTIVGELKIDAALIVSTPAQVAIADVIRGISMFQNKNINIPLLGIVNNMAYFTPAELPDNKYYIFGHGNLEEVASSQGVSILAEIPLIQSVAEGGDKGEPIACNETIVAQKFTELALTITKQVESL